MFTARGCVWPVNTLDPDYLYTVRNVRMILLVPAFASNFFFTWAIPIACACACCFWIDENISF